MALSVLNLGNDSFTENGLYPTDPDYTYPPDFQVAHSRRRGRSLYIYSISERTAGAFTLFAAGNFLTPDGFDGALVENTNVTFNGNITLGLIGLGYGEDSLTVRGSVNLAIISTDDDPTALFDQFSTAPMFGLPQGSGVSKENYAKVVDGFMAIESTKDVIPGYADKVEIRGDLNLGVISTGLASDTVTVSGALQGVFVLLDGIEGLGGTGGDGNDRLDVNTNSNLAGISCGAGNDQVNFYAGVTAVDVNGGDGNDAIRFSGGMLGDYQPDMADPLDDPNYIVFGIPLGFAAGGSGNDRITFGRSSSSYGVAILGGDPFGDTDGDDIISFQTGASGKETALRKSLLDLGDGADRLEFGRYSYLYKVIIRCGGVDAAADGDVDVLNFSSRAGASSSVFDTVAIVGFGDEDKAILSGVTYTGEDARTALTAAGFNVVPLV